jgi:hypothetical protein
VVFSHVRCDSRSVQAHQGPHSRSIRRPLREGCADFDAAENVQGIEAQGSQGCGSLLRGCLARVSGLPHREACLDRAAASDQAEGGRPCDPSGRPRPSRGVGRRVLSP